MKKLLTVSAIVFLMIFTAGLATAKKVASIFPFTGTGELSSVSDTGVVGAATSATITVNEASNGLFNGTIVYGTSPSQTTINFSAVLDSEGRYTLNGLILAVDAAPSVSAAPGGSVSLVAVEPVTGGFTISQHKTPSSPKHAKGVPAAAIGFRTLNTGTTYSGLLFTEAE